MNIVLANYRYFMTGGPERYMFSLMDLLKEHGHEAIPFSVAYAKNKETKYGQYFVSPPGDAEQVYFKDLQLSWIQKLRAAIHVIYSSEAKNKLEWLIRDLQPDLIQTLQIHTVLSYSIIDAAKKYGIPVVSRMSNYQLMCPAEHFLRNDRICEECTKSLYRAIRYKCVQNSVPASTLRVASLWFHRLKKTFDKIDRYIVPSNFLRRKMLENGFPESKVVHIPGFVNVADFIPSYTSDGYITYIGRIAVEKGIPDLVKAFSKIKSTVKLILIGDYQGPEGEKVFKVLDHYDRNLVEFVGYQSLPKIKEIVKGALFTICSSLWYENSPNSIYESFALGKPVLGTRIGSIEEQIEENKTGLLFEAGNVDDLADKMDYLIRNKALLVEMGREARTFAERNLRPEIHYNRLMAVYEKVIEESHRQNRK